MKLNAKLVQGIVESSIEILGKNVNIMDESGIIIASGDHLRINTFHEGAAEVIKTKKIKEIYPEQNNDFRGARPGINLPIEFEGTIVGVVGITGNPEEVRNYGRLVKNMVELMLRDSIIQQQLQVETQAKERFMQNLLQGNIDQDGDLFFARAKLFGYDLKFPCCVIVMDMISIDGEDVSSWLRLNIKRQFELERLKSNILTMLKQFQNPWAMMTFVEQNRLVAIHPLLQGDDNEEKTRIWGHQALSNIHDTFLKRFKIRLNVGTGEVAHQLGDISRSFKSACLTLKICERISPQHKNNPQIHHWDEAYLGHLLEKTPAEVRKHFYSKINPAFFSNDELISTMKVFFDSHLNVSKAAKKLFIHRNTLTYRLNRIKNITGLDPQCFHEAVNLYLAVMLYKYHDEGNKGTFPDSKL